MADEKWESIAVVAKEMNLDLTLSSGQAFRWVWLEQEGVWAGSIRDKLFILRHHGDELQYKLATPTTDPDEDRHVLMDYFRLETDLSSLYLQWSEDDTFRRKASWCQGIRLLRQPTLEALVAFICSANNNISRITGMVSRLCDKYGRHLGRFGGQEFHSFPEIDSLVGVVSEQDLREMGFGYRARYVKESVEEVGKRGGDKWLSLLRQQSYEEAWLQLQQLVGVGAKVADCVCLMGLNHLQAVPVDVHMWRLAQRDYGMGGASKTLTPATQRAVGEKFREVFGATAGWAQAVLFTAELQNQKTSRGGGGGRRRKNVSTEDDEPQSKRARKKLCKTDE